MWPKLFALFWHRIRLAQSGQGLTFWKTPRQGKVCMHDFILEWISAVQRGDSGFAGFWAKGPKWDQFAWFCRRNHPLPVKIAPSILQKTPFIVCENLSFALCMGLHPMLGVL